MTTPSFVPQLIMPSGTRELEFYKQAFGAKELRRWSNDDGSIHVAEMSIGGALFHFHEESPTGKTFPPGTHNGVTAILGLMVDDVDVYMSRAIAAGALEASAAQDYDYGYRQGEVVDPLGHRWLIEKIL